MDHDEMAKANMRAIIKAMIVERDRLEGQVKELKQQLRSLEAERNYWQRCAVNND